MVNRVLAIGALLVGAALIVIGMKVGVIDRGTSTLTAIDSPAASVIRGLVFVVAGLMIVFSGLSLIRRK